MMIKKADSQLIKQYNEIRLLNLIRDNGPISRIELAKLSRISKVAVSEIVNRLDEAGFITEVGKGEASVRGGKRPRLLKLNPENKFVVGIDIRRSDTIVAIANLDAEIREIRQYPHKVNASANSVLALIFRDIDQMMLMQSLNAGDMLGIGVGLPGFIDYENGRVRFADTLRGWDNFPIAAEIEQRYNVPVIIENDVKTRAFGESVLGAGRQIANLIYIWIGAGIGAGIIVNRQLYRGNMGRAGEIGYLKIQNMLNFNSEKYTYLYKNQQFLGELLSESAFVGACKRALAINGNSPNGKSEQEIEDLTLADIEQYLTNNRPEIATVIDEYAHAMAGVCLQMIKTIDPKLIILGGKIIEKIPELITRINGILDVENHEIPFDFDGVLPDVLRREAGIKGAVVMALQSVFGLPVSPVRGHESHV